ncbi:hypothetical protein FDP41_001451 [Naegleria fowleri]|nr:uncharacterized protein FDP41_001451 [Naegleria fowleri]KAF0979534.1 hypothetical protein FDP41_001451 [Naegleria fowleri]
MASLPTHHLNATPTPSSSQTSQLLVDSSKASTFGGGGVTGHTMPVSARGVSTSNSSNNTLLVSSSGESQRKRSNSLAPNTNMDRASSMASFNSTSNIVINTGMSTEEDGTRQQHSSGPLSATMSGVRSETGTSRSYSSTRSSILSSEALRSFEENLITFVVNLQQNTFF